jgi:hypothetical protein
MDWLNILIDDPIYRIVSLVVLIEVLLIASAVLWLFVPFAIQQYRAYLHARFRRNLAKSFIPALEDEDEFERWIKRARRYPTFVLREFFNPYLNSTKGRFLPNVINAYRRLGLLRKDVRGLRSRFWHKRMIAVRRLMNVASGEEKKVLQSCRNDRHLIKLVALQILGRIGSVEDVFSMIRDHYISNRLMEQPFFVLFTSLPLGKFRSIMIRWNQIECPRMRRVLLICSSRIDRIACIKWLPEAARSDDVELRIAACIAASELAEKDVLPLLMKLSRDERWEVRAQAAKALGILKNDETIDVLEFLMEDSAFWTRQYAAGALINIGKKGQSRLQEIAVTGKDRFAKDTATQELQRVTLRHSTIAKTKE